MSQTAAHLFDHVIPHVPVRQWVLSLTLTDRIISGLGLGEMAPQVFVPWASCADAAVKLLGLPYEAYRGALFLALGAVAVALLRLPA